MSTIPRAVYFAQYAYAYSQGKVLFSYLISVDCDSSRHSPALR